MNKINKCNKSNGIEKTLCKVKKQVCDRKNHEIVKAGARIYSIINPTQAIVVPISEVSSVIVKEVVC